MKHFTRFISLAVLFFFSAPLLDTALGAENFFFKRDKDYADVLIVRLISTDTVVLENGERIKLIGIRSPFKVKRREKQLRDEYGFIIEPDVDPATPVEERALEFAEELLIGKQVRLEFDAQKTSENHETYAYVFLKDGKLANTEILRQGFAHLQIKPPNTKYADQLREAYKEARSERRGLQGE